MNPVGLIAFLFICMLMLMFITPTLVLLPTIKQFVDVMKDSVEHKKLNLRSICLLILSICSLALTKMGSFFISFGVAMQDGNTAETARTYQIIEASQNLIALLVICINIVLYIILIKKKKSETDKKEISHFDSPFE